MIDLEPWRKVIDAVGDNMEARWAVFERAVKHFSQERTFKSEQKAAIDDLGEFAAMCDLDIDRAQALLAETFGKPEPPPKPNGKDRVHAFSMREFVKMFVPPDFLIDGMLQRRFVYALTGQTGHAKSAVALFLAELVASPDRNTTLGRRRVAKGKVLYLVGENPDDIRMRVIGYCSLRNDGSDPLDDQIYFIPGTFDIEASFQALAEYAVSIDGVDLVMVDTSAAYFLGADEISNVQMGQHARLLRRLTTLPGGPCVLVLCHPIKHAIEPAQLLPRGGGAFLAEMDGNLTLWKHDDVLVELSYTKMRGPGFEPLTFRLETIWPPALQDAQGRQLPTVRAVPIDGSGEQQQTDKLRDDEDRVLVALMFKPFASLTVICEHLQWQNDKGEPLRSKAQRALGRLEKVKPMLIRKTREGTELTEEGKKVAAKAHAAAERARDNAAQEDLRF